MITPYKSHKDVDAAGVLEDEEADGVAVEDGEQPGDGVSPVNKLLEEVNALSKASEVGVGIVCMCKNTSGHQSVVAPHKSGPQFDFVKVRLRLAVFL